MSVFKIAAVVLAVLATLAITPVLLRGILNGMMRAIERGVDCWRCHSKTGIYRFKNGKGADFPICEGCLTALCPNQEVRLRWIDGGVLTPLEKDDSQ